MGHTYQPCKGSEILHEGEEKNARAGRWARVLRKSVLWTWHGTGTHEFTGTMNSCTRPAQNQTSQGLQYGVGESYEAPPLAKELSAFADCGGG